jgi:hypothetical protein
MSNDRDLPIPSPSRQVAFHQLLVLARKTWLSDALSEALKGVDIAKVRSEVTEFVPEDAQSILASAGIRDETVFPVPTVLEAQPTLVGYYRLLIGVSQKAFYRSGSGMGVFKSMETAGVISRLQRERLPAFCRTMCHALAELLRQISPPVTPRDVYELPLVTLGSQLQGGVNVAIGKKATEGVFLSISEIVERYVESRTETRLILRNSASRRVIIRLSTDPDVSIQEDFDGELRSKVAMEIKGGTDVSNVHNRIGEAEKSHQKAKAKGFRQFWTLISTTGVDVTKLQAESPTTNLVFDVAQVLGRVGEDWERFRSHLAGEVGVPLV